jgi:putative acetyltransferase
MTDDGAIAVDDPNAPDVRALIGRHRAAMLAASPPEHAFALDADGLADPAVTVYGYRRAGRLLAIGALRELDPAHGEIKSMHTADAARGRGAGRAMLAHLLGTARSRGYARVSLETGTMAEFAAARALYASAGFRPCEPFGDYQASPDNCFFTITLGSGEPALSVQNNRDFRDGGGAATSAG